MLKLKNLCKMQSPNIQHYMQDFFFCRSSSPPHYFLPSALFVLQKVLNVSASASSNRACAKCQLLKRTASIKRAR